MKPALVLGLALAAKAFSAEQLDNELIIAPTDQYGNIKQYPRNIRFDEQADDQLLVRPISTYVADDELRVAPRDENGNIKYPNPYIRYDEEGNEFFVAPTHRLGEFGHHILYDNELAHYAGDIKELLERQMEYKGRLDDEADDELLAISGADGPQSSQPGPSGVSTKLFVVRQNQAEALRRDDEEGNELWFFSIPRYNNLNNRIPGIIADDELMMSPFRRRFEDAETGKTLDNEQFAAHGRAVRHKKSHPGLDQFTKKHPEIALDDELLVTPTSARFDDNEFIKAPKNKYPGNVMYDEEADDDLFATQKTQENQQKPHGENGGYFSEVRAQGSRYKAEGNKRNGALKKGAGTKTSQTKRPGQKSEIHAAKKAEINKNYHDLQKGLRSQHPSQGTQENQEAFMQEKAEQNKRNEAFEKNAGSQPQEMELFLFAARRAEALRKDDEIDDEFTARHVPSEAQNNHQKPKGLKPTLFVNRQPQLVRNDDEAENELFSSASYEGQNKHKMPMGGLRPTLFVNRKPQFVRDDDEGDDELAYLGELLQDAHLKHQGVPSGAFVRVLDDNDDELFEVKGKVRPFLPFS